MDVVEFIIEQTKKNSAELFRQARFIPSEKLEWKPAETSRHALDIVAECALSPTWAVDLIEKGKFDPEPDMMEKFVAAKTAIKSVEEAEQICTANSEKLFVALRSFPAERLGETVFLPFGQSHDWPWTSVFSIHWWNCVYHLGQINYIQTLLGDTENH